MSRFKRVKPRTKRDKRALAWCNRVREKQGLKPVKTFAAGIRHDSCECVIARTAHVEYIIGGRWIMPDVSIDEATIRSPKYIADFYYAFDRGWIPYLISESE